MQIHGAYTRGIQGHLFTVSAVPNAAGRLHVAGVRDTVAQHTATTVTHALKRLGIGEVGADVRLEPAGAGDPPLTTGRYSGALDLPIALALLAVAGKLPADRIAGHRGRRRPRPLRRDQERRRAVHRRRRHDRHRPRRGRRAASG